jgi:hypothetical protein
MQKAFSAVRLKEEGWLEKFQSTADVGGTEHNKRNSKI